MIQDAPSLDQPDVQGADPAEGDRAASDPVRAPQSPSGWVDRRLMGVAVAIEVLAVFMAYMVVNVPVGGPQLTDDERPMHWYAALVGALIVAAGVFLVVRTTLRARRLSSVPGDRGASVTLVEGGVSEEAALPPIPRSLRFETVSPAVVRGAGVLSVATIAPSVIFGAPLWLAWLAILAPWLVLVAREATRKYSRDAVFACFGLLVVLQLLHMVEHSTQIGQLLVTQGDLSRSHGAIGQLDFELVHFVTDTALWVSLGYLAIIFKGRNVWLWVAFAAASLHQIEHFYLFYLDKFENTFYLSGGVAGIMGDHGLIGSPLDRPYLHYTYNVIVLVPLLIAFWDEARWMDRKHPQTAPTAG